MKKIIFLVAVLSLSANASVRTDIEDRSPEEVVRKAQHMAESEAFYGPVIGSIISGPLFYGTGIALNSTTVLTAAHIKDLKKVTSFCLHSEGAFSATKDDHYKIKSITLHSTFKRKKNSRVPIGITDNTLFVEGIELKKGEVLSFKNFQKTCAQYHPFQGIDLAILKLDRPIIGKNFPQIMDPQTEVKEQPYGITLGHGPMLYNTKEGAKRVTQHPKDLLKRHLITTKISPFTSHFSGSIFYGSYKGEIRNGSNSFIPDASMKKMEGLPVEGDSGGPLFILHEKKYKLVGILSLTSGINTEKVEDMGMRKNFGDHVQSLFPTWTDVRQYKKWIEEVSKK
jgi:hypothetical protein